MRVQCPCPATSVEKILQAACSMHMHTLQYCAFNHERSKGGYPWGILLTHHRRSLTTSHVRCSDLAVFSAYVMTALSCASLNKTVLTKAHK